MPSSYKTHIVQVGNSKGIRIPKEFLNALGSTDVVLELVKNSIVVRPHTSELIPRAKWASILSKMDTTSHETELTDWDTTLNDGIEEDL